MIGYSDDDSQLGLVRFEDLQTTSQRLRDELRGLGGVTSSGRDIFVPKQPLPSMPRERYMGPDLTPQMLFNQYPMAPKPFNGTWRD